MKRFDFPISLDVEGRRCVVLGGGPEATDKALRLSRAGARVQVVAEEIEPALEDAAEAGELAWAARSWSPADLNGAFLVLVTPDERERASDAYHAGKQRGALVSSIDDPEHCDFAAPALLRAGDLLVTLSTGGRAPSVLKRLREDLAKAIATDTMARFVAAVAKKRAAAPDAKSKAGKDAVEGFAIRAEVTYPPWFTKSRRR